MIKIRRLIHWLKHPCLQKYFQDIIMQSNFCIVNLGEFFANFSLVSWLPDIMWNKNPDSYDERNDEATGHRVGVWKS